MIIITGGHLVERMPPLHHIENSTVITSKQQVSVKYANIVLTFVPGITVDQC